VQREVRFKMAEVSNVKEGGTQTGWCAGGWYHERRASSSTNAKFGDRVGGGNRDKGGKCSQSGRGGYIENLVSGVICIGLARIIYI